MKHTTLLLVLFGLCCGVYAEKRPDSDYSVCMRQSGGVTLEMHRCLSGEIVRQDNRLNRIYRQLMARLPEQRREQLRQVQRLWIKWRDGNCGFYADPQGGTMHAVMAEDCVRKTTAARAKELERFMETMDLAEGS